MTGFEDVIGVLGRELPAPVAASASRRQETLHLRIGFDDVSFLALALRGHFGAEIALVVASDFREESGVFRVSWVFADPVRHRFVQAHLEVPGSDPAIPSLATFSLPAARFEREIRDVMGIEPEGHPDPRPLVRHAFWPTDFFPLRRDAVTPDFHDEGQPYPFSRVHGDGVYEIPVGPVHAGVIEPGHFRFSVLGETVINMESRLYFVHKGVEKLFEGRLPTEAVVLAERISGDSTVGHALAFAQAIESLARNPVPRRAAFIRVVLAEMERIYNHVTDFGMIANDGGFAFGHAQSFRLRESLRLNQRLTGNRLLHGGIRIGGVGCDLPADGDLPGAIDRIVADFDEVVTLCLHNTILQDRLQDCGRLDQAIAKDHGVLGYVARASGLDVDARRDHPYAAYDALRFRIPVLEGGDVWARTMIRIEEVRESARIVRQAVEGLPDGPLMTEIGDLDPFVAALGVTEGWRGTIHHWIMTDHAGRIRRAKIKDPSFLNWHPLSLALLDNIVPDFPLCNKSFNQSYAGNDL